jgi:hypothetical protein
MITISALRGAPARSIVSPRLPPSGARMMLVLRDGTQLPVDTMNGQLMVTLSDGTMRAINNKGKVAMK